MYPAHILYMPRTFNWVRKHFLYIAKTFYACVHISMLTPQTFWCSCNYLALPRKYIQPVNIFFNARKYFINPWNLLCFMRGFLGFFHSGNADLLLLCNWSTVGSFGTSRRGFNQLLITLFIIINSFLCLVEDPLAPSRRCPSFFSIEPPSRLHYHHNQCCHCIGRWFVPPDMEPRVGVGVL